MDLPPGLVIDALPEVTGAELAALDTYIRFEVEFWRALIENETSDVVSELAGDDVVAILTDAVDRQVDSGYVLGGTLRIDPEVQGADNGIAVVSACLDQSGVRSLRDGEESIPNGVEEDPTFSAVADLAFVGDGWIISDYQMEFEPCG